MLALISIEDSANYYAQPFVSCLNGPPQLHRLRRSEVMSLLTVVEDDGLEGAFGTPPARILESPKLASSKSTPQYLLPACNSILRQGLNKCLNLALDR